MNLKPGDKVKFLDTFITQVGFYGERAGLEATVVKTCMNFGGSAHGTVVTSPELGDTSWGEHTVFVRDEFNAIEKINEEK